MEQSAPFVVPPMAAPPGRPNGEQDRDPSDPADSAEPPVDAGQTVEGRGGLGRPRGTPSVRPALVVVGAAALLVTLFGIGAALSGGTSKPTGSASRSLAGTSLPAVPARSLLARLENRGTPPTDVFDALLVPKGSSVVKLTPWVGLTQYSASASLQMGVSQAAVLGFFKAVFAHGWHVFSTGPAHNNALATEVLAQRASDDGWYWDAGVTVLPSRFGATGSDTTSYTIQLFEVPDAQ